jgi:hypothetical protein
MGSSWGNPGLDSSEPFFGRIIYENVDKSIDPIEIIDFLMGRPPGGGNLPKLGKKPRPF